MWYWSHEFSSFEMLVRFKLTEKAKDQCKWTVHSSKIYLYIFSHYFPSTIIFLIICFDLLSFLQVPDMLSLRHNLQLPLESKENCDFHCCRVTFPLSFSSPGISHRSHSDITATLKKASSLQHLISEQNGSVLCLEFPLPWKTGGQLERCCITSKPWEKYRLCQ